MKIKYVGPATDYSGYGEANRHDIASLVEAQVQVTTKIPVYTPEHSDFGRLGELAQSLQNTLTGYNFIIMHVTPNVYKSFMEPQKYHIGRLFWETDKIPLEFATNAQLCDELWTGSEYNAQAIRNAGVTKPIIIIPEAIDVSIDLSKIEPYITVNKDTYKFYSVFEWTERKNPTALLTAYWQEFQKGENVSLTIKTYVDNFNSEKKREIERSIERVKSSLGLKKYAPVYLYEELMDRHQIYRFHKSFDCFVSAHRGEGWGIPQMEALLVGNPIISTNCGGIHEYLTNKKDALLIPFTMTKLVGNSRNQQWYTVDQNWAQVDIEAFRKAMRYCYKYPEKAKAMGISGGKVVREKFCFSAVGKLMRERLKEIEDNILFPTQYK